jgi:hypothetical protein
MVRRCGALQECRDGYCAHDDQRTWEDHVAFAALR